MNIFDNPNSNSVSESFVLQELSKKEQRKIISNLISEGAETYLESN